MATKRSPAAGRGQDAGRGRDLKALEQRRLKAGRLFAHGTSRAKVDPANAHTRKAWLCFLDESAVSLTPPVRRTWAPRGVTPVLRDRQRHRPKVSMVGMLCYRPDGSAARLLVGFHRGSYDTATLVEVLTGLHAFLSGAPVNLVWDNLKAHKSTAMRKFVADQDWLQVNHLPAYAPELNPVEGLWANVKGGELANRCCQTARGGDRHRQDGMIRVRRDGELPLSFRRRTGSGPLKSCAERRSLILLVRVWVVGSAGSGR
jgi:transposase